MPHREYTRPSKLPEVYIVFHGERYDLLPACPLDVMADVLRSMEGASEVEDIENPEAKDVVHLLPMFEAMTAFFENIFLHEEDVERFRAQRRTRDPQKMIDMETISDAVEWVLSYYQGDSVESADPTVVVSPFSGSSADEGSPKPSSGDGSSQAESSPES